MLWRAGGSSGHRAGTWYMGENAARAQEVAALRAGIDLA
jgi:hypothetical protein